MPSQSLRINLCVNATPQEGGQGLNLSHVANALRNNHAVTIFCRASTCPTDPPARGVPPSRIAKLGLRVPVLRRLRDWWNLVEHMHFDEWVAKHLPDADVVVASAGSALSIFRAAKRRNMKCVLDVTTTHVDHFGEVQDRELARFGGRPTWHPWLRKRTRHEYELADAIRVMSQVAKRTLVNHGVPQKKIFVALPPIARPDAPQANFSELTFRVDFVGLIEPAKGFHYLIEAFDRLDIKDSQLTLWGGPGLRGVSSYLAERVARNPRIVISPQSVQKLGFEKVYSRSSVVVLPSLADGFGYVVGEAMSCGVPVIVTTATGAADLIEDGVNGFVVPPADVNALIERLRILATDMDRRRRMGTAARETALRYGPEQFQAAWDRLLASVL
ncbi:MAG: glycosyltransferase family 4 protein [Gemmatales bacterium]|nr:glycosyltransferase family 4 protein [Gemmatales bacterium]MDW8387189.1 glycosyltransferase family 4 protein [Gemmatales bacterium]